MGLITAASVSQTTTDAANTMAPALNEPINETDKLSTTSAAVPHDITTVDIQEISNCIDESIIIDETSLSFGEISDTSINFNNNFITNNNNPNKLNSSVTTTGLTESESDHSIGIDNIIIGLSNDNLLMDQRGAQQQPQHLEEQQLEQQQQVTNEEIQNEDAPPPNGNNMGLQKDYFKDSPEMEQMIGDFSSADLDLLQVIKSLTTAPADGLCEIAGGLSLFNDVDVMNMSNDEVQMTPPNRDTKLKEQTEEIMKKQAQMQRKHDFLLRRLSKLQSRYMGQHISEEVAGLFEYTQRYCKKKEREHAQQTKYAMAAAAAGNHYGDDGLNSPSHIPDIIPYMPPPPNLQNYQQIKPCSSNAMKTFLKRIENSATAQNCQHSVRTSQMKYFATSGGHSISESLHSSPSSSADCSSVTLSATSNATTPIKVFPNPNCVVQRLEESATEQLEMVSGMLECEMKTVYSAIDSDATASSSGGESADELIPYNISSKHSLSISNRAAWRWARDRASVASRWNWLLAQIADLEYKIRQHTELNYQIKKNKGAVTLDVVAASASATTTPAPAAATTATVTSASATTAAATASTSAVHPPAQQSVNGYRGVLPGSTKILDGPQPAPNGAYDQLQQQQNLDSMTACRTRPFQSTNFRKRKLLQIANLHTISKKAARSSTVKCGCQWPIHPCGLCTGRADPTAPRDVPDTMSPSDRVALLDPCFHSVLSFPEDVSHSIHFEAIMRLPDWQTKVLRCSAKGAVKTALALQKSAAAQSVNAATTVSDKNNSIVKTNNNVYNDGRRKFNKKGLVTNKLKKTKTRRGLQQGRLSKLLKQRKNKIRKNNHMASSGGSGSECCGGSGVMNGSSSSSLYNNMMDNVGNDKYHNNKDYYHNHHHPNHHNSHGGVGGNRCNGLNNGYCSRSKNASPVFGSGGGGGNNNYRNERITSDIRRSRTSYDIDNIIIPHSIAASSRVEIIPYKQIPTPKWQIIDPNNTSQLETTSPTEEIEDTSDNFYISKHERALLVERKKFQRVLPTKRSRTNRRIDSRAESSGANTPDPTSPAPNTPNVDQESNPSPAYPSTPLTPADTQENSEINITNTLNQTVSHLNGASTQRGRRRTISLKYNTKDKDYFKDDVRRSSTPDVVQPFEPMQFPLPPKLYDELLRTMPFNHLNLIDDYNNKYEDDNNLDTALIKAEKIKDERSVGTIKEENTDFGDKILLHMIDKNKFLELKSKLNNNNNVDADDDRDSLTESVPDEDREDPNDPEWHSPTFGGGGSGSAGSRLT